MIPPSKGPPVRLSTETESRFHGLTLERLPLGAEAEVVRVEGSGPLAQRLMAMGFLPGGRVRVLQVAPLGDPIAVELNGWRLGLRRSEASTIRVRGNGRPEIPGA